MIWMGHEVSLVGAFIHAYASLEQLAHGAALARQVRAVNDPGKIIAINSLAAWEKTLRVASTGKEI